MFARCVLCSGLVGAARGSGLCSSSLLSPMKVGCKKLNFPAPPGCREGDTIARRLMCAIDNNLQILGKYERRSV